MLHHLFSGIQYFHLVVVGLAAVGFFVFWARTQFWLPKYAHILALIALLIGAWIDSTIPKDAPIMRAGPVGRILLVLLLPGMVYFFFVFYGGQRAAFAHKPKTAVEIADLIERFLSGNSLYPLEWNDFVSHRQPDKSLDVYREGCALLDPLVNCPGPQDPKALDELRKMAHQLRGLSALG